MELAELLKNIPHQSARDLSKISVTGLSSNSRDVKAGDVFFAISGTKETGLNYAKEAASRGAVAILHDTDQNLAASCPVVHVQNTRQTLAKMAAHFFRYPSEKFYLCGVTGTNGKTTTTYLLDEFAKPLKTGVIGTISIRYEKKVIDNPLTTPDALMIQNVFSEMREAKVEFVVMEASSHALEQFRVEACEFDSVVFTNLTQDHLDYHQNMEAYFLAKTRLFWDYLPRSHKKNKCAVINIDSDYGKRLIEKMDPNLSVKTYSAYNHQADMSLKSADYSFSGTMAEIIFQKKNLPLKTNLIGEHNLQNIMAALLIGLHKGFVLENMLQKLSHITVPGRLQKVRGKNIFVDYAHSPDALKNVICALKHIRKNKDRQRLIVVFGCGGDRDQSKRPLMGEVVAKEADITVITSDNPRTEDPLDIIDQILSGVTPHQKKFDGNTGYLIHVDREDALKEVVKLAKEDDIVLVAGKGHEDYQIIGEEKRYFDDKEILETLI